MINEIIFAKSRSDLEAATRALDRILLWNHYVVPQWTYGKARSARWDRFGRPNPMPRCNIPRCLVVGRRKSRQNGIAVPIDFCF
jgi:ABC-type oligopeptide transport system substrate-binding subunit